MEQPTAIIVAGKGILKDAEVHVAIGPYGGSGAARIGKGGVQSGRGIGQANVVDDFERGAVEGNQISVSKVLVVDRNV